LLAIALAAWWLASRWVSREGLSRWLVLGPVILILIAEAVGVAVNPILSPVLDPYIGSGASITVFVGFLAIAGFRWYPRLALACLSSIMLLLLGLFLPAPGLAVSPLLDRPLVEMVLFVPLAVLGATGAAGVLEHFAVIAAPLKAAGIALVCVAIAVHAWINYSLYPADCCMLVHNDDLVALDWIGNNLTNDARFAIPQADVQYAPSPYPPLSVGTDGGVWITPLTGRPTANLPYSTDFSQAATLEELCGAEVSRVYVSAMSQGFQHESLDDKPSWYEPELFLPGARIYRVIGCAN